MSEFSDSPVHIPPFEDSRRLTGPHLHFAACAATLNATGSLNADQVADWRRGVATACGALGWPAPTMVIRPHSSGTVLTFSAPVDQLLAATEVNEWAICRALGIQAFYSPGWPPIDNEPHALQTLRLFAADERAPQLQALIREARQRGLPTLSDDDEFSVGHGACCQTWPRIALPAVNDVDWSTLAAIPVALVTGSNGKTTTVRLIAAMLKAHGLTAGYSSTDGVFVDGETLGTGDYSGPAGARHVLRHSRARAAVLETARGGILRRGLAADHADVAVVTNVSADHFGEYGIDDLAALAEAKFTVARALDARGTLVVNADDPVLAASAHQHAPRLGWFASDNNHPALVAHRAVGGTTCGVEQDELTLSLGDQRWVLGWVNTVPLFAGGVADYNIANASAAALAAFALGVRPETIGAVLATFGANPDDNPGRLERYEVGGLTAFIDYAHNPAGLHGLLRVAQTQRSGRMALLLGQAGNRRDTDLRMLAEVAVAYSPDLIVLKGIDGYARGRADDEVARHLGSILLELGYPEGQLAFSLREIDAVRTALEWARAGDVLTLPVHALSARAAAKNLINALIASDWLAEQPLPN